MQEIPISIQEVEELKQFSVDALLRILAKTSTDGTTIDDLHNRYFGEAKEAGLNVAAGVVRTPQYIAEFMVSQCLHYHKRPCNGLTWYDPCVGSGEFPLAILKTSIKEQGGKINAYEQLPSITISELSKTGVLLTSLAIELLLRDFNLSLNSYLQSGRLAINCGDALLINPANDLYSNHLKYDVVIGNPPYVRASRLSIKYRKQLSLLFPATYTGTADLFYHFIANGVESLNENGALCFISPANFFRASSAKKLRAFLQHTTQIHALVDLDELPVFADADIHTAIYLISKPLKVQPEYAFDYLHLREKHELDKLRNTEAEFETRSSKPIKMQGWSFADDQDTQELLLLENNTLPLKELGIKVYSGVRPGVKQAFVYKSKALASQIGNPDMAWFKESLTGKSIVQWNTETTDLKLLFIPKGTTDVPDSIADLLTPFRKKLEGRPETLNNNDWMSLRSCSYYHLFKNNKIVFPDISSGARFCLDTKQRFVLDGAFFIDSEDLCLLGILNSTLAWTYFKHHCSSIGNASNKGRVRLKKAHVEKFPMPKGFKNPSPLKKDVEKVVESIIFEGANDVLFERLNKAVIALYRNN